jgi:hypothetical protein
MSKFFYMVLICLNVNAETFDLNDITEQAINQGKKVNQVVREREAEEERRYQEWKRNHPEAFQNNTASVTSSSTQETRSSSSSSSSNQSRQNNETTSNVTYKIVSREHYAGSTDKISISCSNKGYDLTMYYKDGKYCEDIGFSSSCVESLDKMANYKCTGRFK